jgi:hypothetical protein
VGVFLVRMARGADGRELLRVPNAALWVAED